MLNKGAHSRRAHAVPRARRRECALMARSADEFVFTIPPRSILLSADRYAIATYYFRRQPSFADARRRDLSSSR